MIKITDTLYLMTRLLVKRQKLLSATYHTTVSTCTENKDVIKTESDKLQIVDKKTESKLAKYEISDDIMTPPPKDEEIPNAYDPKNRIDMRMIPKEFAVSKISKSYTMKAEVMFESLDSKPKTLETFKKATELYLDKEGVYHRGMVEFNLVALDKMKEFNVHKDLNAYKALMNVFPKERLKPQSFWQAEFQHYPKQQDCAITIIDEMERNGVMPDVKFCKMLADVFGSNTYAARKLQRTMYWMPKFLHANPYPIPKIFPKDKIELAKLALKRMAFDINTELTVWHTNQTEDSVEEKGEISVTQYVNVNTTEEETQEGEEDFNDNAVANSQGDTLVTRPMKDGHQIENTFIVSAQSPEQQELIRKLSTEKAVFVDGGFNVWLRHKLQTYFVLRTESEPEPVVEVEEEEDKDLFEWTTFFEEEQPKWLAPKKTVHEQEDGDILAMCITGTSSRDSLVSWIRYLQKSNPNLEQIPVIFKLRTDSLETGLVKHVQKSKSGTDS